MFLRLIMPKGGHLEIFWPPRGTIFLVKEEDMSSKRRTYGKPRLDP